MGKRTTVTRHKNDNTFRFQGQKEKERKIVVNRLGSIRDWLREDDDEEQLSCLYKAMVHWQDLNLYAEFTDILSEIGSDVKSLAQVLHQKERIKDILLPKICVTSVGFLDAIFGLLTAFVSDLRQEFIPYLPTTFSAITDLVLSTKNTEIIALAFDCYSRLLMDMKLVIIKEFSSYFKIFQRLLSSRVKGFVVESAAKAVSFICSKVSKSNSIVFCRRIYKSMEGSKDDLTDGIAILLHQIIASDLVLKNSLDLGRLIQFVDQIEGDISRWDSLIVNLLKRIVTQKRKTNKEMLITVWNEVEKALSPALFEKNFSYCIHILQVLFENYDQSSGALSSASCQAGINVTKFLIDKMQLWEKKETERNDVLELLCASLKLRQFGDVTEPLLKCVVTVVNFDELMRLDQYFQEHFDNYTRVLYIFGGAFKSVETHSDTHEPKTSILRWYSDLILTLGGGVTTPEIFKNLSKGFTALSSPCYYYKDCPRRTTRMSYDVGLNEIVKNGGIKFVEAAISKPEEFESRKEEYLRLLLVLKQIDLKAFPQLRSALISLMNVLIGIISSAAANSVAYSAALYLVSDILLSSGDLESLTGSSIEGFVQKIEDSLIFDESGGCADFNIWNLKLLDLLLYTVKLKSGGNPKLLTDYFGVRPIVLIRKLSPNLMSGFKTIRNLTLSVCFELCGLLEENLDDLVHFLQLALENEACELEITSSDHLTNYITMESCIKNAATGSEEGILQLTVMTQYLLGIMFQNHAKVMEACRNTLIPLVASRLSGPKFWEIIGPKFMLLHGADFTATSSFVPNELQGSSFVSRLMTLSFGFKHTEVDTLGKEFKIDYIRYKINLWMIMRAVGLSLPQSAQTELNSCLYTLYEQVLSPPPYVGIREDPSAKEVMQILTPALEYLSGFPSKRFPGLDRRKEICLGLLLGPKTIQKSAVTILRKISPTINDFLTKLEKLGEDDWVKSVHLKPFEGPDAFYRPPDRPMYIQFILRSLLALKSETKGHCMDQIVSFICRCTEDEALGITKFLFGEIETWKGARRTLSSLKYLKGNMKTICKMIPEWRFNFPNVVSYLVERVCHFVRFVEDNGIEEDITEKSPVEASDVDSDVISKNEELPMTKRKKDILSAARTCIVHFFDLFEKLPIQKQLLDLIFETFIWTADAADTASYSSDSISWLFQLMMVWSRSQRYHTLFIKCKDQDSKSSVVHRLFDAFESQHLKSAPHVHLMEVVTHLGLVGETEADEDEAMHDDIPALDCGEVLGLSAEGDRIGEKILFSVRDRLLRVITKTDFFKDRMFLGTKTDYYINFLRLCTRFSNDASTNHKLCSTIINLLPKFKNKPTELTGLLQLVEQLLQASGPNNSIAVNLSTCLTWVQDKGPREALCNAISEAMTNKNQANLVRALNAYTAKVGDTPDFEVRQEAFSKCTQLVRDAKKFKNVFFTILSNNCFFYLSYESDIGIVAAAEGLLVALAERTKDLGENDGSSKAIHLFLNAVVARLKYGVRNKSDEIFGLYLKVLSAFGSNCHTLHGTFKGVNAIFQSGEKDLLVELQEMQLSSRARATNQFQQLWPVMRKQPGTVVDFVIPILSHYLLDKTKQKVALQNLIQCSLDALKWCAVSLPHGAYFKYFEVILESIPEDEQLLKQYHRLLGAILDAYHYELDEIFLNEINVVKQPKAILAVPEDDKEGEEEEVMDVQTEKSTVVEEQECGDEIVVKLNYDQSKSLMKTVEEKFIPKLRKYLHLEEKASHKLARMESNGDALIKKIPTTLAYVKLLHKLPACVRKNHMLWVVPTLCSSLNSRMISVRSNVRNTLVKIVEELGPPIFPDIVRSAKATLTRGYQKHVRNFTLLHILKQLKDAFAEKPWFVPIGDLVSMAEDEIFGYMAEDKEINEILKNTPEAKSQNGLQLLHQCALLVSKEKLDLLLKVPVERAKTSKNLGTIKATRAWMTEIASGLSANKNVTSSELIRFLWEQLNLHCQEKYNSSESSTANPGKYLSYQEDTFIVPSAKKQAPRQGAVGVVAVVSWFVYSCLYNLLKKESVEPDAETLKILDLFAKHIVDGKNDETLEIRTPTVRSLILLYQFPLKSFLDKDFVTKMWRKYFMAVNEAVSNEDINMYYKFLTTFCVTFSEHRMDLSDFCLLIKCLNKHLQDNKCTGSALVLLRNILQRSLESDDLTTLIREVKRRISNDDSVHVQEGCRAAYVVYVKNYLKTKDEFMKELYDFFKTLGYRKSLQDVHSVYKMIAALISVVPDSWISDISTTIGMDLVLALMKSSDEESQRLISNSCMKNLFDRMSKEDGLALVVELEKTVENPEMIPYQREICLSINKIIEHRKCWESEAAALKLVQILNAILTPSTLSELQEKCKTLQARHRDFGIYEAITASRIALQNLVTLANLEGKISKEIQNIIGIVRNNYINYSHESIQDVSFQLINQHLEMVVAALAAGATSKVKKSEFMMPLTSSDCLLQLIKEYVKTGGCFEAEDMRANVLKGLGPLSRLTSFHTDTDFHEEVMKCLRVAVNIEVRKAPKETLKRDLVFQFCSHYVTDIPDKCLVAVQQSLVNITTRERTDSNVQGTPMADMCAAIQKKLEQRVGRAGFLQLYEQSRSALQAKRDHNRAKKKEQVVLSMDPQSQVSFRKRKKRSTQKGGGGAKKKRRV